MNINTTFPIFRFASLRSPKPKQLPVDPSDPTLPTDVMPSTALMNNIVAINESGKPGAQNLADVNAILQNYISGADFMRTPAAFFARVNTGAPNTGDLELMYDNLVVRLLTKSNTNEVYALLVKYIKEFAAALTRAKVSNVRLIIPERITFTFNEFAGANEEPEPDDEAEIIRGTIARLTDAQQKIREARENDVVSFITAKEYTKRDFRYMPIHQALGKSQVTVKEADAIISSRLTAIDKKIKTERTFPQTGESLAGATSLHSAENMNVDRVLNENEYYLQLKGILQRAAAEGITTLSDIAKVNDPYYAAVLGVLNENGPLSRETAEKKVNARLSEQYRKLDVLMPGRTFALVAGDWKEVTGIANRKSLKDETTSTIIVYEHGCALKYPVQVADLRVIEQQTVGYLPAEIAHISNTQRGEKNTRITRRLKKVETAETIINESEVLRESDTQSAERFSIESDASQVQQEENSLNVNATVSYTMGPLSASVNGGYSSSSLALSSNSTAETYAKDILTRIVDRVSNRTRVERSVKTVEEFEESVTHEIDNSSQETKSYVYRWLNKLVRGTLKNYGKRLIFEVDIGHPAHFYLSRAIRAVLILVWYCSRNDRTSRERPAA